MDFAKILIYFLQKFNIITSFKWSTAYGMDNIKGMWGNNKFVIMIPLAIFDSKACQTFKIYLSNYVYYQYFSLDFSKHFRYKVY